MKKTPDISLRVEEVEVLVRPVFPESEGRWAVIVRDGVSQVTTFDGPYLKAKHHAEYLFSIIAAMHERVTV